MERVIIAAVYVALSLGFFRLAMPKQDVEVKQALPYFVGWGIVSLSVIVLAAA